MSDTIGDGSYEDYLAHYGVKGMRWGKRNASSSSGNGGTPKQTSKERTAEIKAARKRIVERDANYRLATQQSQIGVTAKDRQKGRDKASKIVRELEESGDIDMAGKYTRGEKIAVGLLYGASAAFVADSVIRTLK